jgi:DNA repair exonuclease SbcCD ATPase subunit
MSFDGKCGNCGAGFFHTETECMACGRALPAPPSAPPEDIQGANMAAAKVESVQGVLRDTYAKAIDKISGNILPLRPCPVCNRHWPAGSEQAHAIDADGRCIVCSNAPSDEIARLNGMLTSQAQNIPSLAAKLEASEAKRRHDVETLRKALQAATAYLHNAKIDIETGAPKRTAIQTIEGGLGVIRAALETTGEIAK